MARTWKLYKHGVGLLRVLRNGKSYGVFDTETALIPPHLFLRLLLWVVGRFDRR